MGAFSPKVLHFCSFLLCCSDFKDGLLDLVPARRDQRRWQRKVPCHFSSGPRLSDRPTIDGLEKWQEEA